MDSRGGCCIARYEGNSAYDMSKVNRIMLKFRPIAPKPATSGGSPPPSADNMQKNQPCKGKKRYVKDNKRCTYKKKKAAFSEETSPKTTVTLPLLPLMPEPINNERQYGTVWLNFSKNYYNSPEMVMKPQDILVRAWVIVECVTDTWVESGALGCTDEEKVMNLENDTCPGFVSDGESCVKWTNSAMKRMVGQGVVRLVMMGRVDLKCAAFTCRVRLQYTSACDNGGKESSITLPCDVWRMDGLGVNFAWRLDVDAALSLGR